jgi:hypothetical protein
MADIGETMGPLVESLLEPGETLEGMCVGSRQGLISGKVVVIAATDRRLIVQETDRKQNPKGEPTIVTADQVAKAGTGGFGAGDLQSSIMNATSITIKVKTTDGEKLKLAVAKGGGPLGKLMGGEAQERGVKAVNAWLARNAQG